jgi:hypothetical protein
VNAGKPFEPRKRKVSAACFSRLLRASSAELLWNSKTEPWKSFVPERVTVFICAPELRPNSAEKLLVIIW